MVSKAPLKFCPLSWLFLSVLAFFGSLSGSPAGCARFREGFEDFLPCFLLFLDGGSTGGSEGPCSLALLAALRAHSLRTPLRDKDTLLASLFHGNPLTMVHRILAMRALVENAFPAKSAAKCGSKSKTALGTWNSSAKTPWARRRSCGSAKRLCPHSQILWLGRMQVNMSHAYSGDRRRLVLESMVTVEKSIFRSWQMFFTFSSWHWNESLTGGSHVGRSSSKTSPRVKRLGPFNLCIVIFMSRGYCVSCAPVQLDPHTRSRRCGISRWQLSTLVCSNVWPISLKSSCGRGSKKYHGLCSKDDWIMGNRRNPPWWNTNKLHSYGFLDILSIGGAS